MQKTFVMTAEDACACALYLKIATTKQHSVTYEELEDITLLICGKMADMGYKATNDFSDLGKVVKKYIKELYFNREGVITLKVPQTSAVDVWDIFKGVVLPTDAMKILFKEQERILNNQQQK